MLIRIFSDTRDTTSAVAEGKEEMCWSGDRKVTVSGMETRGSNDAPGVSLLLLTQLPSINPQVSLILSYCGKLFLSGVGSRTGVRQDCQQPMSPLLRSPQQKERTFLYA